MDYKRHNEDVRELWKNYRAGKPHAIPVIYGINPRYTIFNKETNPKGVSFEQYSNDPDLMLEWQLFHQHWLRHNILQDAEMGLPENGWTVYIDFQNYFEAGWFGCPIHYYDGQVPDTRPILTDDKKNLLFDKGVPDPFENGLMTKNLEFYTHFKKRAATHRFHGLPVANVVPSALITDGPLTVATNLRGASEIMMDMMDDPEYVHKLLGYITEATIVRIKAWRKFLDERGETRIYRADPLVWGFFFADDSIALISTDFYRRFVLPHHTRLVSELSLDKAKPNAIHLCGNSTRHFKAIKEELNVRSFDTGFPVDFAKLRRELGPETEILGGPAVHILLDGGVEEVVTETKRILGSGVLEGGRFILRDGNNLAPCTPARNVAVMYRTAKESGIPNGR